MVRWYQKIQALYVQYSEKKKRPKNVGVGCVRNVESLHF